MQTLGQVGVIVGSLAILSLGAEGFVRGSASLAAKFGVSALAIGLTVVAYGTSAPELIVSSGLALSGQGDLAIGNVVGSNIFNIGAILGLTALIFPITVQWQILKVDGPVMVAVAILGAALILDGRIGRLEALLLLLLAVAYTVFNLRQAKKLTSKEVEGEWEEGAPKRTRSLWRDFAFLAAGLIGLYFGSTLLIESASALARSWGVSEAVIGLTIVSAGTSAPELATSITAAIRRQPDIAIGNIVGSNIFNVLGIVGFSGLLAPMESQGIGWVDLLVMLVFSAGLLPLLWTGLKLRRIEGFLLLGGYAIYLARLWP